MERKRLLGRSGIEVSALGLGTAGIGGMTWNRQIRQDQQVGYGEVEDAESMRAIRRALDLGITFFDTADVYGCGRSERILGKAIAGQRDKVIIATKFGHTFDETTQEVLGDAADPAYIQQACEASLRRLGTEYIDVYVFHLKNYNLERASEVRETLEQLVVQGKIRSYGWSTDDVNRARVFGEGPHCAAIMHRLNLFLDAPDMLAYCEEQNLASLSRIPFLMGILTGKHRDGLRLAADDIRNIWFRGSHAERDIARVEVLRPALTCDGRTLAQAALGWIWARSPVTIPMPGFKTVAQVEDNVGALAYGPLASLQMEAVKTVLARDDAAL